MMPYIEDEEEEGTLEDSSGSASPKGKQAEKANEMATDTAHANGNSNSSGTEYKMKCTYMSNDPQSHHYACFKAER